MERFNLVTSVSSHLSALLNTVDSHYLLEIPNSKGLDLAFQNIVNVMEE